MEVVGGRLGRSSTRYGQTAGFTGRVRKWKKRWVRLPNPRSGGNTPSSLPGNVNGGCYSRLLLFQWTPITTGAAAVATVEAAAAEEPPRRRFRYVPVSVIGEQKQEDAAKMGDENKQRDGDASFLPTQRDGSHASLMSMMF